MIRSKRLDNLATAKVEDTKRLGCEFQELFVTNWQGDNVDGALELECQLPRRPCGMLILNLRRGEEKDRELISTHFFACMVCRAH